MRAVILRELNTPPEVRDDISLTDPEAGEVKVKLAAAGVCHSDLSSVDGTFPMPTPFVMGHEGAGEVTAVGTGVTSVAPGDHVILSWMPPCGACQFCTGGQPHLCLNVVAVSTMNPHFSIGETPHFAMSGTGTFSDETVVNQAACIKIEPDIPLDIASLIGCGVTTGVGAVMNTAQVEAGSSVAVFGCGGVGISVIQGARIAGATTIVAVDLVEKKLELAKTFGATHGATPDAVGDLSAELTGGQGFDYAFEVVGSPATIRAAYDATRRGGTAVIVGVGKADQMVEFSPYELFFSEKKILPSFYGSSDVRFEFHRLLRLWRAGKLDLEGMITQRIDLSEVNDAFEAMKSGEVIRSVVEFK